MFKVLNIWLWSKNSKKTIQGLQISMGINNNGFGSEYILLAIWKIMSRYAIKWKIM